MPEGHTIHRLARDQTADLVGTPVRTASVQERFAPSAARLDGRRIEYIEPYGKHMFQWWDGGEVLHAHLGLFGRWVRRPSPPPPPVGEMRLRLEGPGRTWDLSGAITTRLVGPDERDAVVAGLGPDPLRADADPERMWARVTRSRQAIGALLMDQSVVAGIGNVYRAELLFLVGVHPLRAGKDVLREEFDRLWPETVHQLHLGLERNRIVTRRPDELTAPATEIPGDEAWYVYQRDSCRCCGSELEVFSLAGRRTWACPVHQPRNDGHTP